MKTLTLLTLLLIPTLIPAKVPPHRFFLTDSLVETLKTPHYRLDTLTARRIEITNALDTNPDTNALNILTPYLHTVDSITSPVLGNCPKPLTAYRPESPLSNLVADALLNYAQTLTPTHIAICNIGGIRSSIPQGPITYGTILNVCPFENHLTILSLSGSLLQQLFSEIAAVGGEGISGAQLIITSDGQLLNANINNQPLNPDSTYVIATLDYLAEGNDHLTTLAQAATITATHILIRDILAQHIRTLTENNQPLTAQTEGRITIK